MIDEDYDGIDDGDFVEESDEDFYEGGVESDPTTDALLGEIDQTDDYVDETDELASDAPSDDDASSAE